METARYIIIVLSICLFPHCTVAAYATNEDVQYSEGGTVKNVDKDIVAKEIVTPSGSNASKSPFHMDLPFPAPGSSSVKARKGVYHRLIVARKGAPPCSDMNATSEEDPGCPPRIDTHLDGTGNPSYNLSQTGPTQIAIFENRTNSSSVSTTQSSKIAKASKPTITVVPIESDNIIRMLSNDRNVTIPVVALVCAPLLVLLLLLIYKRYRETHNSPYYERMGFLIEDIYTD